MRETSFGGVVVRDGQVLVIVPRATSRLALPKGGAKAGESAAQTAIREIREETGVEASAREPLGDVGYWYSRGGRRIHKVVHYWLCDYVSGDLAGDPDEVDEARWIDIESAPQALSHPGDRRMVQAARAKLDPTSLNL